MKTCLFVACIAAGLVIASPPAMATGPSRFDLHQAPVDPPERSGQTGIIGAHDSNSWNNGYYPPWLYYNQPFQTPNLGWYGNGYYGSPFWGNSHGGNYYNMPRRLTERQVVHAVKNQRFHHITKVWFDDGVYKVRAVDYYGRRVQLLVDPYNGRVLRWSFRR